MLSECFQLRISANEIKKLCNLRERGISLYELGHVARQLGFQTLAIRCKVEELGKIPLPAIAFCNGNHLSMRL